MSKEIRAGGAFIEIYLKEKERLDAKFKSYQARLQAFAKGVAMVGGALTAVSGTVLGGLGAAFMSFTSQGDKLTDTANRIGITTQRLQELTYAATQSGASMEDVERAMLTAQKKGLDFEKVAATIAKIEDPMKRTQAAFAAFGKAGPKIAPMLAELSELSAKANSLGLVFKPEDVSMAGKLADMWGTLKDQAASIAFHVGAALAPAMEKFFKVTQNVLGAVISFIDKNRALVVGIAIAAAGVGALGAAFLAMAGAIWVANLALTVYVAMQAIAAAVSGAVSVELLAVAATVSVLGAVLLAAAAYWAVFTDAGQKAMSLIGATASQTMQGILDAITASNFGLAFEIAWTGALLAFEQFRAKLLIGVAQMGADMLQLAMTIGKQFINALLHGGKGEFSAPDLARIAEIILKPGANAARLQQELNRLTEKAAAGRMPGFTVPQMPKFSGAGAGGSSGQFGTFSAAIASLAGISGSLTVEEKQLKALEGMEDDLAVVRKAAEEGGLVFA